MSTPVTSSVATQTEAGMNEVVSIQEHYKETQRLASVIEDEMVPLYVHNAMQETHHRELDIYYETLNERLRAQECSHQANLHSLTHPCSTQRVVAAGMQIYSAYGTWDD